MTRAGGAGAQTLQQERPSGGSALQRESARRGRPEAAAAIWDWRAVDRPEPSRSAGRLRSRGAIQAAAGFGAGAVFLLLQVRALAAVAFTIAGLVLLSALLSPTGLYRAIDRAFHALGRGIGRALTWLLLPALFYLVFFPFGALFRRGRRDTMTRFFETDRDTYWSPHRAPSDPDSYKRQF